jgi:hypothetical protein
VIQYNSVLHGLREIFHNEGPRALYRGTMARALNNGLSSGIMLGCYGVMRAQLARRLGHGGADEEASAGWASLHPPSKGPRIQSWASEGVAPPIPFPLQPDGAWPVRRSLPDDGAAQPAQPAAPPKDDGFIKPFPWLSASYWVTSRAAARTSGEQAAGASLGGDDRR